ncbi:cell division protein FtsL [Pseudidiomarina terrestris]|uniref:Cell division protein FtsL n=1 Tax=Pseudidiomarina terrestris TaxID=2820060 RepID=A0AAW7QZ53_9GAMM|nr:MULTISPECIES: cell division protein FtsL [unclassified Pseudidiomarina]MDN7124328.1 cell division protein FtsL [Pseudidiomarina sp. 1APP75-32.1]MDN7126329.1 cell division protein FtsL [Pseudidiomarina sp. 1APR75-33.1]MDN7129381.1 cell division protein FtsL [Pseudidiomarina sp. 1APR75-15]MDN7134354.1 cell division protein FtsL [Pseudidiomarina sp. 1ASP75-5]MDN7136958.1 cell division protein FtsL [Pseudidiomarina sp. 1ASP75-14]
MTNSRVPTLLSVLFNDLRQQKLVILLFACILASALAVIYIAHANRLLTIERDDLLSQRDQIDIEWRHLQIEQTALTEHSRVERIASQRLGMVRPEGKQEVLVPWQ